MHSKEKNKHKKPKKEKVKKEYRLTEKAHEEEEEQPAEQPTRAKKIRLSQDRKERKKHNAPNNDAMPKKESSRQYRHMHEYK